jgi:hypothetical protein
MELARSVIKNISINGIEGIKVITFLPRPLNKES